MAVSRRLALLIAVGIPLVLVTRWEGAALLWLLLCFLLCLLDMVLAPSPRKLLVTRKLPVSARLNITVDYTLTVRNPTDRKFQVWLRDAWPPSSQANPKRHSFSISPQTEIGLTGSFTPLRRGTIYGDSITLRSFGPLGLGARQFSAPLRQPLLILPEFRSVKYLPSRLKILRSLEGNTLLTHRGQGSEFDSLREYVAGDDVRDIEWRVSARMRTPVVKTWRPERDRNVVICLDSSRTSASRLGDYPRLDAQIEAALLLGALASSAGDRVHLITFDNLIRSHIQPDRGAGLVSQIAKTLAGVEPSLTEANWTALGQVLSARLRQRSLIVLLTGIEAGSPRSSLMPMVEMLSPHHHVLVASATDPKVLELTESDKTTEDAFLAISAMADLNERHKAADLLPLLGAQVLQANPEKLPPSLADSYLTLKRHGQI